MHLSEDQLAHLRSYHYRGGDASLAYRLLLSPWAELCVHRLTPRWLPPSETRPPQSLCFTHSRCDHAAGSAEFILRLCADSPCEPFAAEWWTSRVTSGHCSLCISVSDLGQHGWQAGEENSLVLSSRHVLRSWLWCDQYHHHIYTCSGSIRHRMDCQMLIWLLVWLYCILLSNMGRTLYRCDGSACYQRRFRRTPHPNDHVSMLLFLWC